MGKIKDFFNKKCNGESHGESHGEPLRESHGECHHLQKALPYKNGKALLVGINYFGTSSQLSGCINDVNHIYRYLISIENFDPKNIHILTDEPKNALKNRPTKANILREIKWLVGPIGPIGGANKTQKTSLFMHYSGHGSWTWESGPTRDEVDGKDECICPVDYEKAGFILDDELRKALITPIKDLDNIKLTALFDCCHSGTVLDLRYRVESTTVPNNPNTRRLTIDEDEHYEKGGGEIVLFSGCLDNQTSADAYINNKSQGMMTCAFLECINHFRNENKELTYSNFITFLQVYASTNGYDQIPHLSTNTYPNLQNVYHL